MLYGDKNEILALIGGRMRSRRLRLNLTQQVAAERSGISVQTLKNLENGRVVSLWAFVSLCRTYGHDDWVYDLEPEQVSDYAARIAAVKKKRQRATGTRGGNHV